MFVRLVLADLFAPIASPASKFLFVIVTASKMSWKNRLIICASMTCSVCEESFVSGASLESAGLLF
ncbi:hypothetical protein M3J09_003392 [Ascochyta lentis]